MIHLYLFPAFYREFLSLGCHILFRTLLRNHPSNFMTCATLLLWLFYSQKKKRFLAIFEMSQNLLILTNISSLQLRPYQNFYPNEIQHILGTVSCGQQYSQDYKQTQAFHTTITLLTL